MTYLFIFGNTPELSLAELKAVLSNQNPSVKTDLISPSYCLVTTPSVLSLDLFSSLGGTVKVAEVFSPEDDTDMAVMLANRLQSQYPTDRRLVFGLSSNVPIDYFLVSGVKDKLESLNYRVRFILPPKGETVLSSVVVTKQKVTEIYLIKTEKESILAQTIWVQDFEDWNRRDYGRPEAESHIGMLPPKVARMMVNLASLGLLCDPFCGTGTILAEALITGHSVVGFDSNPAQVDKTKANLLWLQKTYPSTSSLSFFAQRGDARQLSKSLQNEKPSSIVTEPFLGPASPSELQSLYLSCLTNWRQILPPGGKVVIALPSFLSKDHNSTDHINRDLVKIIIDKAKIMGYSFSAGPFEYARPNAKVRRNICVFEN